MNTAELNSQVRESLSFFDSALFKDVQMSGIFTDSKTFADAIPKVSFDHAIEQYQLEKHNNTSLNLRYFVEKHFTLSTNTEIHTENSNVSINEYIESLWQLLKKPADSKVSGSLLSLENPYIVPGGRFKEIYYWDSYFTALGLIESGHVNLAESMLDNFLALQQQYGCIPNGNRSYYLSRSQPPILALMVDLLLPYQKNKQAFIAKNITGIENEYQFWMNGKTLLIGDKSEHHRVVKMPDGTFLNRYWDENASPRPESYREDIELFKASKSDDPASYYRNIRAACESGWDFSSRWLGNEHSLASIRTTRILPIDLNCLLYKQEVILAQYYEIQGEINTSIDYKRLATDRKLAIQKFMWSEDDGYYMDYDIDKNALCQIKSLAGVLPLFVKLADERQAKKVSLVLQKEFLKQGGLITTLIKSSQQWDSPNGWAPLHWFAVRGLLNFQHYNLAVTIIKRWLLTIEEYYQQSGKIMEKYNVCQTRIEAGGGEYDVQEGFGWTNGVYLAFRRITL